MAGRATIVSDETGAVSTDWVALTAGILILGFVLAMQVLGNSSGYLMDEFESLNREYEKEAMAVSELDLQASYSLQAASERDAESLSAR